MISSLGALRRLPAAFMGLLLSRAEFASVELAQARAQWLRWMGLTLAVALFTLLAFVAASATAVLALWNLLGWITPLILTGVYAAVAWAVLHRLQREVGQAPPLLAQTLQEIAQDCDALMGREKNASAEAPPPS